MLVIDGDGRVGCVGGQNSVTATRRHVTTGEQGRRPIQKSMGDNMYTEFQSRKMPSALLPS